MMVDEFIGQGGTLANLRGWIVKRGQHGHRCGRVDRKAIFGEIESLEGTTP